MESLLESTCQSMGARMLFKLLVSPTDDSVLYLLDCQILFFETKHIHSFLFVSQPNLLTEIVTLFFVPFFVEPGVNPFLSSRCWVGTTTAGIPVSSNTMTGCTTNTCVAC